MQTKTTIPVPPMPPTPAGRGRTASGVIAVLVGAIVIAGLYVWNVSPRIHAGKAIAEAAKDIRSTVIVVEAQRGKANAELTLPGTLLPIQETPIYARTNGYVKRWLVDIGTKVTAGQLLAEIDTPELDRELKQAGANVRQVQANLALAQTTAERWRNLLKDNAVSQQEVDEKVGAFEARKADLAAVQANVQRLQELKSFQRVMAPFAGIITARQVEVGQLIAAGSTDPNRWLYKLAKTDTLRMYVNVPQSHMRLVQPDSPVSIVLREFQGQPISGKVARTAGALDAQKTLLTEVQVPNGDGALMAGMYAQAKFSLTQTEPRILIPSNTLIVRADGPQVAAVEKEVVHMRKITIGRDMGTQLEVLSGLNEKDLVVTNPTDAMRDGVQVKTVMAPPPDKPAEKPADKPAEKVPEKAADKPVEKMPEKTSEKPVDKAADKPAAKPGGKQAQGSDKIAQRTVQPK